MSLAIAPPDQAILLSPLLPALPAAAASTQPAVKLLPLLSPILRQRVQLLSASSSEPWLRLLCYDAAKAAKLADIVRGPSLEPHPVSGEVEVDWGYDAHTRYRRLDRETLQALVALEELGIAFQLVYCVGDQEGGGDGWRIGEVTVAGKPNPFSLFGGAHTIFEAERRFQQGLNAGGGGGSNGQTKTAKDESVAACDNDDDDDDYWGRYDATPIFDEYFAQYDQVQPAMDNHDPDEEAQNAHLAHPASSLQAGLGSAQQPADATATASQSMTADIIHPRPESSASSNGSCTVARLEETAGKQEQNEFGVKQHVSRSIRSLYMLARASGIAREEFGRLVTTELAVLGVMDEDD
ncbi:hypothetical protein OCS_06222 [Ophiocordyceps sinensis CO18]|uniref:Uncharacterized protein n=1 Tax=Ophiocordyceps sinensis (strain Co18 / CGMCC 3.14243) TaxID=911162 RepID=T5A8B3_OPHSC|nr:hypothetical protein OCS_06222 [Ophiocordyceps sinensis CO18]